MKVTVVKNKITKHLSNVVRLVPSRPQIPVLTNVYVEATADNNQVVLRATDLEIGGEIKFGAKVMKSGAGLVSGKVLMDTIRAVAGDKVEIEGSENYLMIKSGNQEIKINKDDTKEYPRFPEISSEGLIDVAKKDIEDMVKKTAFSTSKDEIRPVLTGIKVTDYSDGVEAVTTDGVRLSVFKTKIPKLGNAVIPTTFAHQVIQMMDGDIKLGLNAKNKQITATYKKDDIEINIISQLIEGKFPEYQTIIPKNTRVEVVVDRSLLSQRLAVVMIMARENSNIINIKLAAKKIELSAKSPIHGQVDVGVDAEVSGRADGLEVAINGKYLQEVIGVIDEEHVAIGINDKIRPILIRPIEVDDYKHVLMPINIQE